MSAPGKGLRRRAHVVPALALALACALLALLAGHRADAQALSESQLRARFLLNFLRFTEWPAPAFADASTPIQMCVLGAADPFEGALASLHEAMAEGRRIAVRLAVAPEQVADCHLLYVPDAELRRVVAARETIGQRAVLIVGESDAVLDRGGMIALRNVDRHLAFVVRLAPARHVALNFCLLYTSPSPRD